MPQMGHLPGPAAFTEWCIGHVNPVLGAGEFIIVPDGATGGVTLGRAIGFCAAPAAVIFICGIGSGCIAG